MIDEEKTTLKDELRKLNSHFETEKIKKNKKFKIPFRSRLGKKRLKQGYASVCLIGENKNITFTRMQIKEGTVMHNGKPYLATSEYTLNYKNKPFLIIPEWNIEPFSPDKNFKEAASKGGVNAGYKLILNRLKSEQVDQKKGMSWTLVIIILALIGAAIWYFTRSGNKIPGIS